jgi:hypothetical protein
MAANLLNRASMLRCPHGGTVTITTSNTRTKAGGDYVVRMGDTFMIAGCPFTLPSGTPHPCVRVQWDTSARHSIVLGDAPLLQSSLGWCVAADEVRQGAVMINVVQPRVRGE